MSFLNLQVLGISLLYLTSGFGQLVNTGILKVDLDAARELGVWTAFGNNGTTDITVAAGVPGGIYSDLEANSILSSEIYHDFNDVENKWVGRTNWTFSRDFIPISNLLEKSEVVLVCEGLDTIAEIFINDISVGKSKNMFVKYVFDIKSALQAGTNKISVAFQSPVEYAQNEYIRHDAEEGYPVLPVSLVPEYRGENQAQMIRKMQSSFSWDWGPSYPSSGIWKNIYIEGLDGAVIRDVLIFTTPNKIPDETDATQWNLTARVYLDVASESETGTLTISRQGSTEKVQVPVQFSSKASDEVRDVTTVVPGSTAKLWWPNGYGDQNLYTYDISYKSDVHNETSTRSLRVGFRTVELIQDLVDETKPDFGREFYFKINGVQMYSKGSNSIPIHVLPERATPEMTRWLLESAKDVHTNMIRVWGGGLYESDVFYDMADELGIFIWEDFIFACAMYPATDEFLANVVEEIETQVKRLQHHPSLAMWAANNENEAALRQNWYGTASNFEQYKIDFIKLYIDTIIGNVSVLDPSRQCISSSPTNGIQSELEGWVAQDPGDSRFGDIHHYDYRSDSWDWNIFAPRPARYASEYGYQSYPYYETLAKVSNNIEEWTWYSIETEHRQHHPGGQREIAELIQNHLPFPVNNNSAEAFPYMLYMSQIMQATGVKTESEFYRRLMDKMNESDGTGHNMGALYWQLNDIWQGCSWASFEFTGRWKMFAYYAKKFFAPVLPSPYKDADGNVIIELISDARDDFSGEMRVRVFKLESMTALVDLTVPVTASFLTSKEVHRVESATLEQIGCNSNTGSPCLVYINLPDAVDNFLFLQYPTDKTFVKDPNLRATQFSMAPDGKTFSVTLTSDEIASFVFLNLKESSHGKFSDNGFIMVDSPKTLTYSSRDPMTLDQFRTELDIMSLYNVTVVA